MSIHQLAYGREIFNAGDPSGDAYLAVFTLAGTLRLRVEGREIVSRAGTLCMMNPHQSFSTHLSADHQQLTVRIAGQLLRQHLASSFGPRFPYPLEFSPVLTRTFDQAGTLTNVVILLCQEMGRRASAIASPGVANQFEELVAELLLSELPHNFSTSHRSAAERAPEYVHKALQFIHANVGMKISVEDIANASSVTPRTLQIAFRRFLDVTPSRYLRNLRLDLADRALSEAAGHRPKMSSVAHDLGFSNASKFARHFRERFGCNPSASMRRWPR